ncbi:unnamed protein product, partial [marine sediment metagenome]
MESLRIIKIKGQKTEIAEDLVTEEISLKLFVGCKLIATLICSPTYLEDLVRGFFITSGLIEKLEDIRRIVLDPSTSIAYIFLAYENEIELPLLNGAAGSGCGSAAFTLNALDGAPAFRERNRSASFFDFRINNILIKGLMTDFRNRSLVYRKTGGVHSAALADKGGIIGFREDIGRHNAIDKIIGHFTLKNKSFEDNILITSGRISSDVLIKM